MQSRIWRVVIGVLGASALVGGLTACAGHRGGEGGGAWSAERVAQVRGKVVERVSQRLDLDAAQRQKLDLLADAVQAQRLAMVGQGGSPRDAVRALVAGATFDRAQAQALLTEKTRAVEAHGPAVIAALGDFYDSLRPEQQARVRDLLQRRHGWFARG